MATPYNDLTMRSILQSLPEIQRKKRRAEQLRKTQEQFQAMDTPSAGGSYLPTTHGGLFQTVQRYVPDYAGMGNQISGALGDYLTGREAEKAEEEYGGAQGDAILKAMQQYSQGGTLPKATLATPGAASQGMADRATGILGTPSPSADPFAAPSAAPQPFGGIGAGLGAAEEDQMALEEHGPLPSQETLRAYMGMLGGPDVKDYLPKDPADLKARDTEIDEAGNIWTQMSNGEWKNSGIKARTGMKVVTDIDGNVYQIPTTSQSNESQQVTMGGGSQAQGPQNQPATLDRDALHEKQLAQESGGNPNAVSSAGARGRMQLMPDTARRLEEQHGYPAGSSDTDPAINERLGRLHMDDLIAKYGNYADALMAYNRGEPNHDQWIKEGRNPATLPAETHGYLKNILGADPYASATGATVSPTGNVSGGGLNLGSDAAKAEAKGLGDAVAKAKESLGKAEGAAESGSRAIAGLLSDPEGLKSIVGQAGTIFDWGSVPDSLAQYAIPFLKSGEKEANAFAKWKTVQSNAFLQAFEELRGGGQITEAEGTKAENAKAALSRAQSYDEVVQALKDLQTAIDAGLRRARARARGDFSGDNALSVTAAPTRYTGPMAAAAPKYNLPPGFSIEED